MLNLNVWRNLIARVSNNKTLRSLISTAMPWWLREGEFVPCGSVRALWVWYDIEAYCSTQDKDIQADTRVNKLD